MSRFSIPASARATAATRRREVPEELVRLFDNREVTFADVEDFLFPPSLLTPSERPEPFVGPPAPENAAEPVVDDTPSPPAPSQTAQADTPTSNALARVPERDRNTAAAIPSEPPPVSRTTNETNETSETSPPAPDVTARRGPIDFREAMSIAGGDPDKAQRIVEADNEARRRRRNSRDSTQAILDRARERNRLREEGVPEADLPRIPTGARVPLGRGPAVNQGSLPAGANPERISPNVDALPTNLRNQAIRALRRRGNGRS